MTHPHPEKPKSSRQDRLAWAAGITGAILVLEAVGGYVSGSLALLSDAGHMLTDLAAMLVAWSAMVLAGRRAGSTHTYGFARLEVLAALANAMTFFLMIAGVVWGAVDRLAHPHLPDWKTMGVIAFVGLFANILSAWFLHGAEHQDLNMRAAFLHVMGDLASSVAVLVGAAVIAWTGLTWVDPVLSIVIAVLIAVSAFGLLRNALRILLESSPRGLTPELISGTLRSGIPGISDVHHVHLWEVGSGDIHMTAHLTVKDRLLSEGQPLLKKASDLLREKHSVTHCTFQLETEDLTGSCVDPGKNPN